MNKKFEKKIKGYYIDPIIFTFKFACACNGECCHYGVYTDLKEHHTILANKNLIISNMDDSQTKEISVWFEQPEEDDDFDSGVAIGTEIHNDKCTFLDKNGLCSLQKMAINRNEWKWKYKPLYCILFPLTIYEGALTVDDEHIDRLKYCNKHPISEQTIVEYCKEEIIHLIGEDGYDDLIKYRDEYLSKINEKSNQQVLSELK